MKYKIILVCSKCNSRNYTYKTTKFIENLNKYCSNCKKNTIHNGNK
ncbi:50S ribosomal protein L33 [Candidatus Mycoplasma haematobovis]|nr:50S ribosomal protein L33 [Candidatus Mycoplasma haematobovis]